MSEIKAEVWSRMFKQIGDDEYEYLCPTCAKPIIIDGMTASAVYFGRNDTRYNCQECMDRINGDV
jgi:DNA-directed RNA polymerase subunit RPC12/RpoP